MGWKFLLACLFLLPAATRARLPGASRAAVYSVPGLKLHRIPALRGLDRLTELELREMVRPLNPLQRILFRLNLRFAMPARIQDPYEQGSFRSVFFPIRIRRETVTKAASRIILVHEATHLIYDLELRDMIPSMKRLKENEELAFREEYRFGRRILQAIRQGRIPARLWRGDFTLSHVRTMSERAYVNLRVRQYRLGWITKLG